MDSIIVKISKDLPFSDANGIFEGTYQQFDDTFGGPSDLGSIIFYCNQQKLDLTLDIPEGKLDEVVQAIKEQKPKGISFGFS